MNVADSSAWLEYSADGPNAGPTICVLEVFKRVLRQRGEDAALDAAARLGLELKLPLADSVVLATARRHGAVVWTQDADFEGLPDVKFTKKR